MPVGQNVSSQSINNETGSLANARSFGIKPTWIVATNGDDGVDNTLDGLGTLSSAALPRNYVGSDTRILVYIRCPINEDYVMSGVRYPLDSWL